LAAASIDFTAATATSETAGAFRNLAAHYVPGGVLEHVAGNNGTVTAQGRRRLFGRKI